MNSKHVFLILDPNFGEQVAPLSATNPVWIVGSSHNTPVVHRLWQQYKVGILNTLSLTLYQNNSGGSNENLFGDMLISIDEHHGEATFSLEEAYTQLTVLGMLPTSAVEEDLADMGLQLTATFAMGFVANKLVTL